MYKIGENEMVICPYNRYHVVSKLRLQSHIVKCKKNHPDVKLSTCFYNYCHRLNPENMLAHYGVCSHKIRVESSRYEPNYYSSTTSEKVKDNERSRKFPDINIKPQFFCKNVSSSSGFSTQLSCENTDNLDFSDELSDDSGDSDDDLEPLPLPKTVSKAFMCAKQKPDTVLSAASAKMSQTKGFGRAKNLLTYPPPKSSSSTEHLLPDLSSLSCSSFKKRINSNVSSNNIENTSASIVSSIFDETSTFRSEEIFEEDDRDKNNAKSCIFENLDEYINL